MDQDTQPFLGKVPLLWLRCRTRHVWLGALQFKCAFGMKTSGSDAATLQSSPDLQAGLEHAQSAHDPEQGRLSHFWEDALYARRAVVLKALASFTVRARRIMVTFTVNLVRT